MSTDRDDDEALPQVRSDEKYTWFSDDEPSQPFVDRLAEAFSLFALLFALGIGFVLAMLPVSVRAAALPAPAAASAPTLELSAFKVAAAAPGTAERLVAADQARAGDRLEYRAVYRNPTAAPVHHVTLTIPVPANGVEYVLETASPRADLASTDGRHFAALPLQRVETTDTGAQVTHPAPAADYRYLRWNLGDVPAGAVRTVHARVQILAGDAPAR